MYCKLEGYAACPPAFHQKGSPRKIDVEMGYNGGLAIYRPESIIVAKVA
jgi:hypothetical protein